MIYLLSTIFVLLFLYGVYKEKINESEMSFDEELSSVLSKLPENKIVCEEILKELNSKVDVEYNPYEEAKGSFYNHRKNKIVVRKDKDLGNISRIVHIAHECVHTTQKRNYLNMNFIFSNIQILFFLMLIVIRFFNVSSNVIEPLLFVQILVVIMTFFVKIVIESDACYRAVGVAEEYLKDKIDEDKLKKYVSKLNQNVIKTVPLYYYSIISQGLCMVIITRVIYLI